MMPAKRSGHRAGFLIASCLAIMCAVSPQLIPSAAAETQHVTLTVGQVITSIGLTPPPAETFTYRLTPKTANAPMPRGSDATGYTFTITGTSQASIGPLDFDWAQEDTYELTCTTATKAGFTVDTQVFTIDVYVLNNQPSITVVHESDGTKTDLSFTHRYTVADPPSSPVGCPTCIADPPQTNDPSNPTLWIAVIAASTTLLLLLVWRGRRLFSGKRQERAA